MNLNHRSKYSAVAAAVALACAVGANTTADAASVVAGSTLTFATVHRCCDRDVGSKRDVRRRHRCELRRG